MTLPEDAILGQWIVKNFKMFMAIVAAISVAGFFTGSTLMGINGNLAAVGTQLTEIKTQNAAQDATEKSNQQRIGNLENKQAATSAQYDAMMSSIADLKQSVTQTNSMMQQVFQSLVSGSNKP